jgi:two-component system, NtrC family, response regulator GlrR
MGATRILSRPDGAVVVVKRARLKVLRGPAKGTQLELDSLLPVVLGSDDDCELHLDDDTVSARHAELRPVESGWRVRDLGSTNGLFVDGLRVVEALLEGRAHKLTLGESEVEWKLLGGETEHPLGTPFGGLIGEAPLMRALFAQLSRAAASDSTVLLEGPSGSGKEVLAHALHAASTRRERPFVVVDCGALAGGLVESELYGHEKGAFTGADRARTGALEEASTGTLFLDEIGELPLAAQVKLLRALEAREVKPLGASRPRPIDVRVVAASHRPLARLTQSGAFREDLYYRLAVVKLRVPPLSDRREDLLSLARRFIAERKPGFEPDKLLSPAVQKALESYDWPGNVRELRNVIERLLSAGELATELRARPSAPDWETARRQAIDEFERDYCRNLLAEHDGNISKAAASAGLSRQMLHRLLRKYDLP